MNNFSYKIEWNVCTLDFLKTLQKIKYITESFERQKIKMAMTQYASIRIIYFKELLFI